MNEPVDELEEVRCACCQATVPRWQAYFDPVVESYVCDECVERYAP